MTQSGRRALRKGVWLALLLFGAAIWALRTREAADGTCTLLRQKLPALTGLDVGIARCELDPLGQTVRLQGVSLFEPGAETPLIAADLAELSLGAWHPLFGSVELDEIRILRPRISLDLTRPRKASGGGGCSLEVLRQVEIGKLDVRNAEVRIALPGDRHVELSGGDITWRRRRGRAEIKLTAGSGRVIPREDSELELTALAVDARFDAERERVELTRAELALDALSVSGAGVIEDLCAPELALEASLFVPLTTVARAAGLQQPVAGHVWTHLALDGPAADPTVTIEASGRDLRIGRYAPGGFDAQVVISGGVARLEKVETSAGNGVLRARGSVALSGSLATAVELEAQDAQFGPTLAKAGLPGAWVDFPANGRAHLAGNLWPLHLEGTAELDSGRFHLASRAWDAAVDRGRMILEFERARASGNVVILPDRAELLGMRVRSDRTEVRGDVVLNFAREKGLSVRGEVVQADFADFGHLVGIHWAGKGSGTFEVVGPYSDVRASAALSLRDFDFWKMSLGVVQGRLEYKDDVLSFPSATGQKGRTQYFGSAQLDFAGDGPFHSRGQVTVVKGRLEDVADVLLPMHANMDHFQDILEGDVEGTVTVDSPSDAFAGTVDFQLGDVRYFDRRLGNGQMVLHFEDGQWAILEPITLRGPLGVTRAQGRWNFDGPLDFRFRVDGSLAEAVGPQRANGLELHGGLALEGKVGGDTTVWTVTSWLTSPAIHLGGKNLGPTHLEGRMVGRDLHVWGRAFDGATTNLKLRAKTPYPFELAANVALPEIRSLLPQAAAAQGLSGALVGSVNAAGNLKEPRSVEGRARLDKLVLSRADFTGQNDGRVELSFKAGRLAIDQLRFRGPNTLLTVGGAVGPKQLDVDLHGSLDMRMLESFVPQLERSSGRVELTAAARGTVDEPTLAGTAAVSDARLSLRDLPVTLRGLSGRVEFSEARLLVQDVRGVLNDGRVELDGNVRLTRFSPQSLQLRVQVDGVSLRLVEYLPFTASGELILYGKPERMTLAGDLDLDRLRYDQPLELDTLLTSIQSAKVGAPSDQPRKEWLDFDVKVSASGDVRVENNLAKARLFGDVRLTGTNLNPGLLGTLEAAQGSEIYFRGNTFNVSQALVEFKERKEIDPVFDLHAQTLVREYAVNLHGFGRIKDPQLILTADPELAEADILSLLTLGVTSRDQSDLLGTGGLITVTDALFNASGLDRQVQRFLPKNPVLRDLSFHISSGYNETSGAVEPMAQFESKFLTEKLSLAVSRAIVSGKDRARAEYQFNDRMSGQLQWDNEREAELPNFGVDLKLRWEVE